MAINNFISTVWSENLLKKLEGQYVGVMNCNREFEGDIDKLGATVKICGVGDVTVSDYVRNSDMKAPQELNDYAYSLNINRAKYFNFQIDDVDKAQSSPKLMDEAMKNAAAALANEADAYVYSLFESSSNIMHNEDGTAESIINNIIDAKTVLIKANVTNSDDIVVEVSPEIAALIIKAKIDLGSDNYDALEAGLLGKIAGCKIYVSNNIYVNESNFHQCIVRSKRAVAFAEQISEVEAYRPEKRFADAVKGLHLYGAKIVYPDEYMVLSIRCDG